MLKQKKSAWLSVGLASLAAMYPALMSCGDRPAGEASMTITEYASKHAISLAERFTIPDECISGKTLFMCGEAHAIAANEII